MGGQPGGGYGYGQQGYYQGGYQQGYDQGYSQNGWQQGDFGFGFDPFGFGFGFGGYQQQSGASYSGSDTPEMQAARNFVANGRYTEARRVLDSMNSRSARWYYLSSLANQGLGNSIDALQDARRAVQLDPNNTEYQMHLRRMQNPGQTYRTQTTYAQPGADALVLEHDFAQSALQLLLWRRLGLAVPDVNKKRGNAALAVFPLFYRSVSLAMPIPFFTSTATVVSLGASS